MALPAVWSHWLNGHHNVILREGAMSAQWSLEGEATLSFLEPWHRWVISQLWATDDAICFQKSYSCLVHVFCSVMSLILSTPFYSSNLFCSKQILGAFINIIIILSLYLVSVYVPALVCMGSLHTMSCRDHWFFPSTSCVPGIELKSTGSVVGNFNH